MNFTRVAVLFLLALSSMAQAMPRPAGPYFEPIPDWQTKATLSPPGIVIAPGDEILPQIANSGTPETGGFFMIFQAQQRLGDHGDVRSELLRRERGTHEHATRRGFR